MKCEICGHHMKPSDRLQTSLGMIHIGPCPSEAERSGVLQGCLPSANCSAEAGAEAQPNSLISSPVPPKEAIRSGVELIAEERKRQVSKEGWTPAHDDKHKGRQLAKGAESYLCLHTFPNENPACDGKLRGACNWPWAKKWWKPSSDPIRNLVKAGALIAAEIDRLQRKQARAALALQGERAIRRNK